MLFARYTSSCRTATCPRLNLSPNQPWFASAKSTSAGQRTLQRQLRRHDSDSLENKMAITWWKRNRSPAELIRSAFMLRNTDFPSSAMNYMAVLQLHGCAYMRG